MLPSPVPKLLLSITAPSETALLDWLKTGISRLMLEEIAGNDYGEEIPEHLAAIRQQLEPSPPLGLLPWNPREVLELEKWSEPDRSSCDAPPTGRHGHLKRLLACTILLRNGGYIERPIHSSEEEFFLDSSATSIIQLTRSAIALDSDAPRMALAFLLWLYDKATWPSLSPFIAFGALLLAAFCGLNSCPEAEVAEVTVWVERNEAECRENLAWEVSSHRWLVGLNSYEDRTGHRERWQYTAQNIVGKMRTKSSPALINGLSSFLERLSAN
jgi:hypothetical protein